jgi:hypothetical protein
MALRILILVCSLTVPAANSSQRDAIPVGKLQLLAYEALDSVMADGHLPPFVGCEDLLGPPQSLADDDGEDTGDDMKTLAPAIREVAGTDPAISLCFPAHRSPVAAQFSSGRIPLRC